MCEMQGVYCGVLLACVCGRMQRASKVVVGARRSVAQSNQVAMAPGRSPGYCLGIAALAYSAAALPQIGSRALQCGNGRNPPFGQTNAHSYGWVSSKEGWEYEVCKK